VLTVCSVVCIRDAIDVLDSPSANANTMRIRSFSSLGHLRRAKRAFNPARSASVITKPMGGRPVFAMPPCSRLTEPVGQRAANKVLFSCGTPH
jgi:hypothetical protein